GVNKSQLWGALSRGAAGAGLLHWFHAGLPVRPVVIPGLRGGYHARLPDQQRKRPGPGRMLLCGLSHRALMLAARAELQLQNFAPPRGSRTPVSQSLRRLLYIMMTAWP